MNVTAKSIDLLATLPPIPDQDYRPATGTPYARDPVFEYRLSDLKSWISEKTGRYAVFYISRKLIADSSEEKNQLIK